THPPITAAVRQTARIWPLAPPPMAAAAQRRGREPPSTPQRSAQVPTERRSGAQSSARRAPRPPGSQRSRDAIARNSWRQCRRLRAGSHALRRAGRRERALPYALTRWAGSSRAPRRVDTSHRRRLTRRARGVAGSFVLAEQFAQLGARVSQTTLGRLEAAAGDVRDLLDAQVSLGLQKESLALLARKLPQRALESAGLVPRQNGGQRRRLGSQLLHHRRGLVSKGLEAHLRSTPSNRIDHPVMGDGEQPAGETG